jgi:hypothetical protein
MALSNVATADLAAPLCRAAQTPEDCAVQYKCSSPPGGTDDVGSRLDARQCGIFHDFHHDWITMLKRALNDGRLPPGYYAPAEQIAGGLGADALTLDVAPREAPAAANGPAPQRPLTWALRWQSRRRRCASPRRPSSTPLRASAIAWSFATAAAITS